MASSQHQTDRRLLHSRHKLRQSQTGLHIAADCIENHQKAVDSRLLLNGDKLRNHMLVLGRFIL